MTEPYLTTSFNIISINLFILVIFLYFKEKDKLEILRWF